MHSGKYLDRNLAKVVSVPPSLNGLAQNRSIIQVVYSTYCVVIV